MIEKLQSQLIEIAGILNLNSKLHTGVFQKIPGYVGILENPEKIPIYISTPDPSGQNKLPNQTKGYANKGNFAADLLNVTLNFSSRVLAY